MSEDDVQMIAYLESLLEAEQERVRVLRDVLSKAVAEYDKDCQHYSSTTGGMYRGSPAWIVPARKALATTEDV